MTRINPNRRRGLRGIELLEPRRLLAAEAGSVEPLSPQGAGEGNGVPIAEFKLDVRQDGQSILDANRNFQVDVGDRFDLELLYSDLRAPFERLGFYLFATDIFSNMPSAFRPVLTEIQVFDFDSDFSGVTGGSFTIRQENSLDTVDIPVAQFSEESVASAVEQLLGLSSGTVEAEFNNVDPTLTFLRLNFRDESLAFTDIPNLDVDTSGLIGETVNTTFVEEPAFVDGDPSKGVNPNTFSTAIDYSSRSLNDLVFYSSYFGGGIYEPDGPGVFRELLGVGPSQSVANFASANSIPFDGTDFEALSIRVEAAAEASGVEFEARQIDDATDSFVYIYDSLEQIARDEVLFDDDDDPSIAGDDRFAIVTGNFGAAALPPFQNPNNRFDVNNSGDVDSGDGLRLLNELNTRMVSAPDGSLPDPPPDPIPFFFDVNGDNLVTQDDLDDVLEELGLIDYGDAPTAEQSGFASDYPTLRANDGARHIAQGDLYLGDLANSENDGKPDPDAASDTDDDGVVFLTEITTASSGGNVEITATEIGKVDAWIDFNRDGDWNDAGEQIFDDLEVAGGTAPYTFSISGTVNAGKTFARFRISSNGVDDPTGRAPDGEVEDYAINISDDSGDPKNPVVNITGNATIANVSGNAVITDGTGELFNQPLAQLETLTVLGSTSNDTVTYDASGGSIVPALGLLIDGAGGENTFAIDGSTSIHATVDGLVTLLNLHVLDAAAAGSATIVVDAGVVLGLSPLDESVLFVGTDEDRILFADAADWRMEAPITSGNSFQSRTLNQFTGEEILAEIPSAYHNLVDPSDVDDNGELSAQDALIVINELAGRRFSDASGAVVDPSTFNPWPDFYMDQNGDGSITANDALRVINDFARRVQSEAEFELVAALSDELASIESFGQWSDEFVEPPRQPVPAKVSVFSDLARSAESKLVVGVADSRTSTDAPTALDQAQVDELLSGRDWF